MHYELLDRAQNVVQQLVKNGYSMQQISDLMERKVHPRTLYRWAKGEHAPQKANNLVALEQVASRLSV